MNADEKIKELEQKLAQVAADIYASQRQLQQLQKEIHLLQMQKETSLNDGSAPASVKMTPLPEQQGIEQFIGLKLIHLVGIIVLVIGLSIGVKYAIDGQLISEMMRIVLAYTAGVLLFILAFRLKKKYAFFSAILFSGSMASIYFTTYAAFSYYHFIPGGMAFAIMAALTVYTAIMAIQYDRKEIAIIGMIGAYGIPFLVSANSDRFELFFSYILLINAGVIFLSFRKTWKLVGQLAMLITWALFIGWALMRFEPSSQTMVATIFMILFYVLFCFNATSFLLLKKQSLSYSEIQQLLLNQAALYVASLCIFDLTWASGMIFIWFAATAFLTTVFFPKEKALQRALAIEALIVLLLWVLLKWDGLTVTLLWVAISVLLFAWGIAGKQSWIRLASILLMGITLGKLLILDSGRFTAVQKIVCYIAIGVLLLVFSFYYQRLGLAGKKEREEV